MKVMVEQVDIVETLTPMSFASFRDRLDTASGFQSVQFRELEFLLGYKRGRHAQVPAGRERPAYARLEQRLREPSVVDAFYAFLKQYGVTIPDGVDEPRPDAADGRRTRRSPRACCISTRRSRTWRSSSN